VVAGALDDPLAAHLLPLWGEPDRQVRLVPTRPVMDPPQPRSLAPSAPAPVPRRGRARGPTHGRRGRRRPPLPPPRAPPGQPAALRPGRRAADREDDVGLLVGRTEDDRVVVAPVVGGVGWIGGVLGPAPRHPENATPVQLNSKQLRVKLTQVRVERGLLVVRV